MLRDLKQTYVKKSKLANEESQEILHKIKQLQKQRENIQFPSWIQEIVEPMTKEIADHYKLKYDIIGPAGINHQITLLFFGDKMEENETVDYKHLTIVPQGKFEDFELYYKDNPPLNPNPYSEWELNSKDSEYRLLPDSIENVIKIIEDLNR